ncbi:MAG: sigL 3 [Armatimonadetes bacterium]|jgi:RNA polymerase sigma-70 factor (ECF subfamily)|nr:sigL 3 [Armatimonadota bacterium]
MGTWTDAEICAGLRDPLQRDAAFRALHLQFGPRLLGFLSRMSRGDRDRAEDLLGRALYKAYVGLARADAPVRSLRSWLYTVAARTALDELEREKAADPLLQAAPLDEDYAAAPGPASAEPCSGAGVDEAVEEVLAQLEQEDRRYRALLEMEHVGVCDRGEIAEATGIPRKQLSQYLKRARERFLHLARRHPVLAPLEARPEEGVTP